MACAAALQLVAATPALAQTIVNDCTCREGGDSNNWWLALFPAGAAGLLALLPGRGVPPVAPIMLPPAVVRPEYAAPPPIALPPAEVGAPPAVRPIAPGADVRIPIRKRVPPPSSAAYNGPVPRFKVLRQLLGVPESAVAARTRETAPATARPAAPPRTAAPSASKAATPAQPVKVARSAAPSA